ncbi:lytic transglycosylase domain-containing protein [Gudongella sp. SC589]|jgi:soluble lytic murein transglycosylase|uniref:lytic transglycosylase domain-containing protein n=1 Tax=Gudongella sp. SC589 TaxID=3385990 RepID=UPI0039049C2F
MKKIFAFLVIAVTLMAIVVSAVALTYPLVYKDSVLKYSKEYNLDPMMIMAVIKTESNFDKDATSIRDARGLMQIAESTGNWASEVLRIKDYDHGMLYVPEINIRFGTWYLRELIDQYGNDAVALAAYNAGSGNVSNWLSNKAYSDDGENLQSIPFPETEEYVRRVLRNKEVYELIYGSGMAIGKDTFFDGLVINTRNWLKNIIKGLR